MNIKAFLNTLTLTSRTLPIVVLYVTEGCNLKCITCSYRDPLPDELSYEEIKRLAGVLRESGLRHIVYSGGEPLMRKDFPLICKLFATYGVKQTLLTNGLLLRKRFRDVADFMTETIVSIDGADAHTHNAIRGLDSFDAILDGIRQESRSTPRPAISIRTVIQKRNFRQLEAMVDLARELGAKRISFLAADVLSKSFGRNERGPMVPDEAITLDNREVLQFRQIVEAFSSNRHAELTSGFVSQNVDGLFNLVQYYEAVLGKGDFPRNHCNAPMVSAVITAKGDVLPCFFLPPLGNIRKAMPLEILNRTESRVLRLKVKHYRLDRCHKCVCTLLIQPMAALFDRF